MSNINNDNLYNISTLAFAYDDCNITNDQAKQMFGMKDYELSTLSDLVHNLNKSCQKFDAYDHFCLGYKIPQIGKEFDLLRITNDHAVNIELESQDPNKPLIDQARRNYYYLKSLGMNVIDIFEFIAPDELYHYDLSTHELIKSNFSLLAEKLLQQKGSVLRPSEIDQLFQPKNFLVSPFNNYDDFLEGRYFLTSQQEEIKNELIGLFFEKKYFAYCIHAGAGTGKTLLIYDIVKELQIDGYKCLIIHTGKKNWGQLELESKETWNIKSISQVRSDTIQELCENVDAIFVDESQRISEFQLKLLIDKTSEKQIPIIFSYDVQQSLKNGENRNIADFIENSYPTIVLERQKLKGKIRTNPEMASFIRKMFSQGITDSFNSYQNVTIEYINIETMLTSYLEYLRREGWVDITFSNSLYKTDQLDFLAGLSNTNAHDVIGQEFDKVVCVLDSNFFYRKTRSGKLKLFGSNQFYSSTGMLYEIVTRSRENLKIVVYKNDKLYKQLQFLVSTGTLPDD